VEAVRDGGLVLLPPGGRPPGRQGDLLPVELLPRGGGRVRTPGADARRRPRARRVPQARRGPGKISGRSALWEREWGVLDLRYVGDSGRAAR
jgi:hypothetical protein